jgi:SAM-dependent methyltransferase
MMNEVPIVASDIDAVRNYWNNRPCNIKHSDLPLGSVEYFDAVEARKYFIEPHIPAFAQFDRWKGKRVLEIGCGIGTDGINFARAGAHYVGVELSAASLSIAKRRFEVFGLEGQLIEADAENLSQSDVPDGPYDLVYSFGVLHHTPGPAIALRQIREFMSEESELKIMMYAQNSWKSMLIQGGLDQPEAQDGCPIALTYTREDIHDLLKESDFGTEEIRQDHVFPYQIAEYVEYRYELEPWFAAMPPNLREAMARHLGWHLLITARPLSEG